MDGKDLKVILWVVLTAFVLALAAAALALSLAVRSARAYDTVDEPCDSGGLEVCDMEPLVLPDMWRYQCGTLSLPEVLWCTERRERRLS